MRNTILRAYKDIPLMTEEEMRAYEQEAPTQGINDGPFKRLSEKNRSLIEGALRGDIPRMASALKQGADPRVQEDGFTVAQCYASALYETWLRDSFQPNALSSPTLTLTDSYFQKGWAWLKAKGVPFEPTEKIKEEVWSILYRASYLFRPPGSLPDHHYFWPEKHLWMLWNVLSPLKRQNVLTWLDDVYYREKEDKSSTPLSKLAADPKKNVYPFASPALHEAVLLEEKGRVFHKHPLSVRQRQERILVLSSLLAAQQPNTFPTVTNAQSTQMLLGLWAFAPTPLLHALREIPEYPEKVNTCLLSFATHLTQHRKEHTLSAPLCHVLAVRLAHGIKKTLETGHVFPSSILQVLLALEEVRPHIEQILLQKELEGVSPSTPSLPAQTSSGTSKKRARL